MVHVDRPARGLLGAHVAERSHQVAGHGEARVVLEAGQAEIGDKESAAIVDHQVGGLDVAVDYSDGVGVLDGFGGLDAQAGGGLEEARVREDGDEAAGW